MLFNTSKWYVIGINFLVLRIVMLDKVFFIVDGIYYFTDQTNLYLNLEKIHNFLDENLSNHGSVKVWGLYYVCRFTAGVYIVPRDIPHPQGVPRRGCGYINPSQCIVCIPDPDLDLESKKKEAILNFQTSFLALPNIEQNGPRTHYLPFPLR